MTLVDEGEPEHRGGMEAVDGGPGPAPALSAQQQRLSQVARSEHSSGNGSRMVERRARRADRDLWPRDQREAEGHSDHRECLHPLGVPGGRPLTLAVSARDRGVCPRVMADAATSEAQRDLTSREKRRLLVLGVPTLGMALALTTVSTYLPKAMQGVTSSTLEIGAIVGGEGIMALWVPLVVGPWSDRLRTRFGGRLPFLMAAAPVMAMALVALGLVRSVPTTAAAAAVFFFAYFVAYEPYRALYPDLLQSSEVAGRSQGTQAAWRGLGTGIALLAGGLLLSAGRLTPFAAAAVVVLVTTGGFAWLVVREGLVRERDSANGGAVGDSARRLLGLARRHPPLRAYLIANALWELALTALKAFVVLYLTDGLGYSLGTASLIVGGVGGIVLAGAVAAGKAGDDRGRLRVMRVSLWVYGLGLFVPALVTFKPVIALAVPLIALGGGAVMALSYAILMPLMPDEDRGAVTGFYSASRGIGITIGPILAGALIAVLDVGPFASTDGYQVTWLVCAAAILLSIPFTRRLSAGGQPEGRDTG